MLRKQNSAFTTSFISEAGTKLENNDYFAYVELEQYACYVIADGLDDLYSSESASLATQTVVLAFQEHPSMRKSVISSYIKAANQALLESEDKNRLKASLTVIVSDYVKIRYAYAGNTRFRLYRNGIVTEHSRDMSLGRDLIEVEDLSEDVLAKHEERNNLYSYLGQDREFAPFISKKIKLADGDILTLYTRGIWENVDAGELDDVFSEAKDEPRESLDDVEELLLSRQPEFLDNYTFAAIFVNKVFVDPNRKRRIKKIVTISISVATVILILSLVLWMLYRKRQNQIENMNRKCQDMIEYIGDGNYVRAGEECEGALELAEKLRDKGKIEEISDYQKLIEAVNKADEEYGEEEYEEAQQDYLSAKERSRYADHISDSYIDIRLDNIEDYLAVFDYMQMGDILMEKGALESAEKKYLAAKSLAAGIHFKEGRRQALDALALLYEELSKKQEETEEKMQAVAADTAGAAELIVKGDEAFDKGDYKGAASYYTQAKEKYKELGETGKVEELDKKLTDSESKEEDQAEQLKMAQEYEAQAKKLAEEGQLEEAKKQYILAKEIYAALGDEDKVTQIENRIQMLEVDMQKNAADSAAGAMDVVDG